MTNPAQAIQILEARVNRWESGDEKLWCATQSPASAAVTESLQRIRRESMKGGPDDAPVLVTGRAGAPVDSIARAIHLGSTRARGSWVAVNCQTLVKGAAEQEFFGADGRPGLLELSHRGTLFLDHVDGLPADLCGKLHRAFQEKVFARGTENVACDVRVVAGTRIDLLGAAAAGRFHSELQTWLCRNTVRVPALAERPEDIVTVARELATRVFGGQGKTFPGFSPTAEEFLKGYDWPGNERELYALLSRAAFTHRSGQIQPDEFAFAPSRAAGPAVGNGKLELVPSPFTAPTDSNVEGYMELKKRYVDLFERDYLNSALARHSGNVSAAARESKLDRSNFLRLLRRHGLKSVTFKKMAA